MERAFNLTKKVCHIVAMTLLLVALVAVIVCFCMVPSLTDPKLEQILVVKRLLIYFGFGFGLYAALILWLENKLNKEMTNPKASETRVKFFAVLNICALNISGLFLLLHMSELKRAREEAMENATKSSTGLSFAEPESFPEIEEGYHEEENVVIRLVSPRKRNATPYQVTGIDDVASKNNWKGWVYLAPVIVLISVFLLYPLINTIFIAFAKNYSYATGQLSGFTLDNFGIIFGITRYNGALEQDFTRYAVPNTILLTFVTVPLSIFIALLISVALNSIKWFQKVLQTVFFLPYVTNAVAIGLVFSVIFDKDGIINFITHTQTTWIYGAERETAMIPLCIYIVWHSLPFKILILLSGLQGIDKQYYQAAQIDSCPKWKVLFRVTVPLLSPQILYIMITSFIAAFKEYTSVVSMFNGPGTYGQNSVIPNMETIVYYVYENVNKLQTSRAAAAAVFLFIIILLFTVVQFKVSTKRVHY